MYIAGLQTLRVTFPEKITPGGLGPGRMRRAYGKMFPMS